jgi:hypothetical protein
MNPSKWIPKLPLFDSPMCVYCGGVANTSDHTPPRCFLPRKLPANFQSMTIPACAACNAAYSEDETRAAVIICTVSFTESDRRAVAKGGWVYSAMQRNQILRKFVNDRLGSDGIFRPDHVIIETLSRVMKKTAAGLLFFEFGRLIHPNDLSVIAIEHAKNVQPEAIVELHRRDDNLWTEVTPSGRELEKQAMAACGLVPRHMPSWKVYLPEFFEYMFIKRSNKMLMCAMKLHDTLTVLLECSWPSRAGPRRRGKPRN